MHDINQTVFSCNIVTRMSMPDAIRCDNPQFLKKAPDPYDCLIVLGKSYLAYALVDEARTTVWSVRWQHRKGHPMGKTDFDALLGERKVQEAGRFFLAIDNERHTLVPAALYQADKRHIYTQHLFETGIGEELHEQNIGKDLVSLFALKTDSVQYFLKRLRHVQFFHAAAAPLLAYAQALNEKKDPTVFLSDTPDGFTLTLFKGKDLQWQQIFRGEAADDRLYHLANIHQQMALDPAQTDVVLHGASAQTDVVAALLQTQYGTVRYADHRPEVCIPEDLHRWPAHYFYTLFALIPCAS